MGFDKASARMGGVALAARIAGLLGAVAAPLVEVGAGASGLVVAREDPPGTGPLAALDAGGRFLRNRGCDASALVVACDLPLLDLAALEMLADWPGDRSVVPIVDGHPQSLCARWSAGDLRRAGSLVGTGARSMRALLDVCDVELLDEARWSKNVRAVAFADADTPADLERLGLTVQPTR
jgi:molybdopterin-guanine dinucleotide biosynthesis protein A